MESMEQPSQENRGLISDLPGIKQEVHKLHEEGKAKLRGNHFEEMFRLPKEWYDFIVNGAEVLKLDEKEGIKFLDLVQELLEENLNAEDEARLKILIAEYEEKRQGH